MAQSIFRTGFTVRCISGNVVRVTQDYDSDGPDNIEFIEYLPNCKDGQQYCMTSRDWERKISYGEKLPDDWNPDPESAENVLYAVKRMFDERGWIVNWSLPLDKMIEQFAMNERHIFHDCANDLHAAKKRIEELERLCEKQAEHLRIFDEWTK